MPPTSASRRLSHAGPALLLCALLLCVAGPVPARPLETATLDFPDVEVDAAARAIGALLGRPIVIDPRVKGRMTLLTYEPVSQAKAYAIFVATLRGLGYAVVESNGLLKVVPEADAKAQSGAVTVEPGTHQGDLVVTQVFRLLHENASNLVPVLRPLISANNAVSVNPGNNSLVITDYASNLSRLGALIAALDTPSATDVEVIPLQHALASELALTVQRMTEPQSAAPAAVPAGSASPAAIVPDIHANALLVRAPNAARLAAVRALVARLDRPGASGAGGSNVHVLYLKHAEASRLASVLRAALASDGARRDGSIGSAAPAAPVPGAAGTTGTNATAATPSQAATPVTAIAAPSLGGYIQADPATNSLILTAPEPLFRELRAVVELLDTRRAQLYVESLVVEVDASKALDVGVQWKQLFNIGSSTELTLGTVATALESMSGTNILSTANVMTLDNEEAKIVVGQNVPFVTGTYTTTSSTANPFQTIERKDVGITLRIRPQIGANGTVRLSIYQEASSVSSSASPGTTNAGPTTNKRSIESSVAVADGKIVVLGGLIEDSYSSDASQLPLLGDLPLVGGLFRSLTRTRKKTNLLVFLRPVVMRDDAATEALSLDRYDFIGARQRDLPRDVRQVLPGVAMPELPAP